MAQSSWTPLSHSVSNALDTLQLWAHKCDNPCDKDSYDKNLHLLI